MRTHEDVSTLRLDEHVVLIAAGTRARTRALGLAYARAGADIALVGAGRRHPAVYSHERLPYVDELEATRSGVEAIGRRCLTLEADLLDSDEVETAIEKAVAELGRLDIVVAVAGSLVPVPDIEPERNWQDQLDNTVPGVYPVVKAAMAYFDSRRSGRIIVVPGGFGVRWRVVGLTTLFSDDIGDRDISVNALCPDESRPATIPRWAMHGAARPQTASAATGTSPDGQRRKAHREFLEAALLLADSPHERPDMPAVG